MGGDEPGEGPAPSPAPAAAPAPASPTEGAAGPKADAAAAAGAAAPAAPPPEPPAEAPPAAEPPSAASPAPLDGSAAAWAGGPAAAEEPAGPPSPAAGWLADRPASLPCPAWTDPPPAAPAARETARGCVRGEVLWYRPEWERPWRSAGKQRHADALAAKEHEVEVQIERNTALRRQLHQARLELRRAAEHAQAREAEHADHVRRLEQRLAVAVEREKADGATSVLALHRRMEGLQAAHDEECAALRRRIAAEEERCARVQEDGRRHIVAQSVAHEEEVAQLRKLLVMKDSELAASEQRRGEMLGRAADERERLASDLQGQVSKAEERYQSVLDAQHHKTEQQLDQAMRTAADARREKDEALARCTALTAKSGSLEQALRDSEADRERWTRRVGAEVESMIDELGGIPVKQPPAGEERMKGDPPLDAHVWQRVAELRRLHGARREELGAARRKEAAARQTSDTVVRADRDRWADREAQLGEMIAEADRIRAQQAKLRRAIGQTEMLARPLREHALALVGRLQFFTEDYREAESIAYSMAECALPPPQEDAELTIVACAIADAPALRATAPEAADAGVATCREVLRAKARQHCGHEAWGAWGDGWVFLFRHAADAAAFALSVQVALVHAPWPPQLLSIPACAPAGGAGTGTLWRGMRLRCAIHHGLVRVAASGGASGHLAPDARRYHGQAMRDCVWLLGLSAPGQVLATQAARDATAARSDELPPHTATHAGEHRAPGTDEGGQRRMQLWELRATPLLGRSLPFPSDTAAETTAQVLPGALRSVLAADADALAKGREVLGDALSALAQEEEDAGAACVRLAARLRELRHQRPWHPEDLVPVLGELDQLVLRHEATRQQMADAFRNQDALLREMRSLDLAVSGQCAALLTDAECRRLIALREQVLRDEMRELEEAHIAREEHLSATAHRKDTFITGLRQEQEVTGGVVAALQRELTHERHARKDLLAEAESRATELERQVARERALNPSRRWDRVPSCADTRASGSAAQWARSPRTPGSAAPSAGRTRRASSQRRDPTATPPYTTRRGTRHLSPGRYGAPLPVPIP